MPFVLGFFVTNVLVRWWDQYQTIPWPYSIAVFVSSNIEGFDEIGRAMRRTIMRYVCEFLFLRLRLNVKDFSTPGLSLTMVFRVLSPRVKARFPRFYDLVEAGLITENEAAIIEEMERKYPGYSKHFMPIVWAASLVNRARKQGRIRDDFAVKTIIDELNKFRGACGTLLNYHAICIPLVYVQVVSAATYFYFLFSLMGQQHVENELIDDAPIFLDKVPLNIILQLIVYLGWLKVAETMLNPFGEDDDDFEVNYLIDRNMIMSYMIVDEMHKEHPELLKDLYWNEVPDKLPDRCEDDEERGRAKLLEHNEVFDVEMPVPSTRATSIVIDGGKGSIITIKPVPSDLKPRQVIDEKYLKVKNVEVKQSNLEREMEVVQKKISLDRLGTPSDQSAHSNKSKDNKNETKKKEEDDKNSEKRV